jgi:hypothetical protein
VVDPVSLKLNRDSEEGYDLEAVVLLWLSVVVNCCGRSKPEAIVASE